MAVLVETGSYGTSGATATSTLTVLPPTGSIIVVAVGFYGSTTIPSGGGPTDASGNAYVLVPGSLQAAGGDCTAWFVSSTTLFPGTGNLVITANAYGFYPTIQAFSINGTIDAVQVATGGNGGEPTDVDLDITSTADGDLFLGTFIFDATNASGFSTTWDYVTQGPNSGYASTVSLTTYPTAGMQTWTVDAPFNVTGMSALALAPATGGGGGGGSGSVTTPFAPVLLSQASTSESTSGASASTTVSGMKRVILGGICTAETSLPDGVPLTLQYQDPNGNWINFGTDTNPQTLLLPGDMNVYETEVTLSNVGSPVQVIWTLNAGQSATFEWWLQTTMVPPDPNQPAGPSPFSVIVIKGTSATVTVSGASDSADAAGLRGINWGGDLTGIGGSGAVTFALQMQTPLGDWTNVGSTSVSSTGDFTGTSISPLTGPVRLAWTLGVGVTSATFSYWGQAFMTAS